MNHEIVCEDFEMTPAIKDHMVSLTETLQKNCEKPLQFHIFLKKEGHNTFKAGLETRLFGRPLYADGVDQNIYLASTKAKKSLKKQILELRDRVHSHSV